MSWSSPARRIYALVLGVSLLLVGTPLFTVASSAATTADGGTAAAGPALPFDLPTSALHASPRKVFAHYVPSLSVSLDNRAPDVDYYARNYLNPDGEGGIHSAYGGFL